MGEQEFRMKSANCKMQTNFHLAILILHFIRYSAGNCGQSRQLTANAAKRAAFPSVEQIELAPYNAKAERSTHGV
jgi:hypothetical protein